ncbi:hypothetical protein SynA1560_02230 [Synechococcus sp. A15-60]|nr:hypothetical protein SynA1560_02230 [Synechococcus sp. A15-60]
MIIDQLDQKMQQSQPRAWVENIYLELFSIHQYHSKTHFLPQANATAENRLVWVYQHQWTSLT